MNRSTSINATRVAKNLNSLRLPAPQLLLGAIIMALLCLFIKGRAPHAPSSIGAPLQRQQTTATKVRAAYGQLPLSFEANHGQADTMFNFVARGTGYALALSPTRALLSLARRSEEKSKSAEPSLSQSDDKDGAVRAQSGVDNSNAQGSKAPAVLRMNIIGANRKAAVEGLSELEGKVNYFVGRDKSQWRTNIPTFARVRYAGVYPGIDVIYYGNQKQLEYDFVVAPQSDAGDIRLEFEGADQVEVDAAGDLLLGVGGSVIRQPKPFVYQEVAGVRREVRGSYALDEDGRVRFALGEYDARLPLVIDPVLVYSTYLGGNGSDAGNDIAVDSAGNAYVCGETFSTNFPTANAIDTTFGSGQLGGQRDAFVTKLNAAGTALVYSTYLGGSGDAVNTNINGDDRCFGVRVDSAGNAYLAGETHSNDFPTANAVQATFGGGLSDAFVTKLNANGTAIVFSTFLGGSIFDAAGGLALDSSNNIYMTGRSTSANYPTVNPIQAAYSGGSGADVIITKLNAAGNALVYSTYLGGNGGNGFENGGSIDVDSAGNAYITGQTSSTNFPTANAIQASFGGGFPDGDAFVTKINAAGNALVFSTYIGGNDNDVGTDIDVDSAGVAHISGFTASSNFPTANALQSTFGGGTNDAFVTKLNAAGTAFIYSTYLGGGGSDAGNDIAVDPAGNTYVAGGTASTNFPTANPLQAALSGTGDTFVTKLNPSGTALVYSTYLGGSGSERANAIALDSSDNVYVTGITDSTNFTTLNPLQAANGGSFDGFVYKLSDQPTPTTVQFSTSTTTNVQEDCTAIQLTVTRAGPTTGTTVVDFATVDGTAKQKTDFTIALGRLTFAPSETSKTIILLINEDSYVEGAETFTVNLSNVTGGSLGTPGAATIQIIDDASEPATNTIDEPSNFICQQYHDLLLREPEPAGTQFYLNILSGCQSSDTECTKYTRGALTANFFRSPEFQTKSFYVAYLYMVTLGQRPSTRDELADPNKNTFERPHYLEFMSDVQSITSPEDRNGPDAARKASLTTAFVQRPEIVAKYPLSLSDVQFAQALQQTAGVTIADQSQFVGKSRAEILRIVAESPEVKAKLYIQAFVTSEYFGFLRRDPDLDGYAFHNDRYKLLAPLLSPDMTENFITRGFIESSEYRQRFGP